MCHNVASYAYFTFEDKIFLFTFHCLPCILTIVFQKISPTTISSQVYRILSFFHLNKLAIKDTLPDNLITRTNLTISYMQTTGDNGLVVTLLPRDFFVYYWLFKAFLNVKIIIFFLLFRNAKYFRIWCKCATNMWECGTY